MREGYILTRKEAAEIFLILASARLKLTGKVQTSAEKYFRNFEDAIINL